MFITFLAFLAVVLQSVPPGAGEAPVRVVAAGRAPFVMESEGEPAGLSIDVWNSVAAELGLDAEIDTVEDIGMALDMVASGERDVLVGPISITAARTERLRFTQPYYHSDLAIMAPEAGSLLDRFAPFLTDTFVTGAIVLGGTLVLVGTLLWLAERRVNSQQFPVTGLSGIGNGVWMALVTMTTVGYGDRVPITTPGRIITGVWMLASLVVASSLTAFLATALTLSQLPGQAIESAEELRGRRVGVLAATTSEDFALEYGARTQTWDDLNSSIDALAAGDLDAVVFDRPMLRYALAERPELALRLSDASYQPQNYGFATGYTSPLWDMLNLAILRLQESGELARIEAQWLGVAP